MLQNKKPSTSHQGKSSDQSPDARLESINLESADICIQKKIVKPSTSGCSFRKPVSRNHPIFSKVKEQTMNLKNMNYNQNVTLKKIQNFQQFRT